MLGPSNVCNFSKWFAYALKLNYVFKTIKLELSQSKRRFQYRLRISASFPVGFAPSILSCDCRTFFGSACSRCRCCQRLLRLLLLLLLLLLQRILLLRLVPGPSPWAAAAAVDVAVAVADVAVDVADVGAGAAVQSHCRTAASPLQLPGLLRPDPLQRQVQSQQLQ